MDFRIVSFLIVMFLGLQSQAVSISILGLQDNSQISSAGFKTDSGSGYGEGLLINAHLGGRWSVSTGALYFNRQWADNSAGASTISSQVLAIPLIFDFHLRFLSIGAGAFYSQNQGTLSESGAVSNGALAYNSYGINNYDNGYLGRIEFHLPIGHEVSLHLGAMYLSGSNNLSINQANTFQNRDIVYEAGLNISFESDSGGGLHKSPHGQHH